MRRGWAIYPLLGPADEGVQVPPWITYTHDTVNWYDSGTHMPLYHGLWTSTAYMPMWGLQNYYGTLLQPMTAYYTIKYFSNEDTYQFRFFDTQQGAINDNNGTVYSINCGDYKRSQIYGE